MSPPCAHDIVRSNTCADPWMRRARIRLSIRTAGTVFVLLSCACSDSTLEPRPTSQPANVASAPERIMSCARAGPLSCASSPVADLGPQACAQLRECLAGRKVGDEIISKIEACEASVLPSDAHTHSAAAVPVRIQVDGPPSHAAYLFVHVPGGWCAADQLLPPAWTHGGYCETRIAFGEPGAEPDGVLSVTSERVCRMPLDQREIAARQSDVASSECRRASYRLVSSGIEKVSQSDSQGACGGR
jgi:hypothetical protein